MGILARFLGFVWKRWADYQSVVAILDVLDFKTAISGGIGFLAMSFIGATNMNWSAPAVILVALAAGALVSVTLASVRILWRPRLTIAIDGSGHANTASSLMADYQAGKWVPSYPPLNKSWPDFDKWDKKKDFRLFEAACLWTNQEPGLPLTIEAAQCLKVLEQAIWDKHLTVRSDSVRDAIVSAIAINKGRESKANPNWVIERDRLLLYASGISEKPLFLFPEERV